MKTCKYCGWAINEINYSSRTSWMDEWFEEICGWENRKSPHIPLEEGTHNETV
jgi:hypothetical protein